MSKYMKKWILKGNNSYWVTRPTMKNIDKVMIFLTKNTNLTKKPYKNFTLKQISDATGVNRISLDRAIFFLALRQKKPLVRIKANIFMKNKKANMVYKICLI